MKGNFCLILPVLMMLLASGSVLHAQEISPDIDNTAVSHSVTRPDSITHQKQLTLIRHKIDSLKKLGLPHESYLAKLDSLKKFSPAGFLSKLQKRSDSLKGLIEKPSFGFQNKLDSLGGLDPTQKISEETARLERKLNKKVDTIGSKLNSKLERLTGNKTLSDSLGNKSKMVTDKLEKLKGDIPASESVNDISGLKDKAGLGNIDPLKGTDEKTDKLLSQVKPLNEVNDKAGELSVLPKKEIGRLKFSNEITQITDQTGKIEEIANKATAYGKEAQNLAEDGIGKAQQLPETLEHKAENLKEIKALKENQSQLQPYTDELQNLGKEDYAKEKVVNKVKEKAVNHFADHQDKLKAAHDKLAKLKRKYSSVESINNLPKRPPNPMKDKSFKERLIMGGNFQVHKGDPLGVDLSPSLGYRFNKRLSSGVGGTYRTTIDEDEKYLLTREKELYGIRAWSAFDVWKGLFAHGEFEMLSSPIDKKIGILEAGTNTWTKGALLGAGRTHKIAGRIKGKITVLYNFLFEKGGPYTKPWNIRFGIELPPAKPKKKDKTNEPKKIE
ncbi:hypothetical protein QQ008_27900 [Fulvivirgaceae bacterium BMA10]|uniref:Uncharacterized protein n=1 Tax=Splendidivirga corallicola TaxID=3051826 RepID=A0ABT8KWT6_9BACT|nr:hypothetical protein [Fulvivirgaceae bacterium BMA10]